MSRYSLDHLAQSVLHRNSFVFHRNESDAMAMAIAHVAEIDARRSYRDEGYSSMLAFCMHVYELPEPAALKRIRVARLAREYPALFAALASRKLSLSCVILLSPHLTARNADELIAAATHVPKSELEQFLAKRFPKPDVAAKLEAVPAPPPMLGDQVSPGTVGSAADDHPPAQTVAAAVDDQLSSRTDEPAIPRSKVSPLSEDRFALQLTISRCTRDKLRYAQDLLSHQLRSGDMAEVFDRALDALIVKLEKRKFAATSRPRSKSRRPTQSARHIPAHVKREVWERDGGQCTFVSESGHRCESRELLEFDHIEEVARGGKATVAGMRLRCRAHNQFEAERTFGAEFMKTKREEAQQIAWEKRAAKARSEEAASAAATAERAQELDVIPWLRALGFRLDDARRAAVHCESFADASLEERVSKALAFLAPRATKQDFRRVDTREGAPA